MKKLWARTPPLWGEGPGCPSVEKVPPLRAEVKIRFSLVFLANFVPKNANLPKNIFLW